MHLNSLVHSGALLCLLVSEHLQDAILADSEKPREQIHVEADIPGSRYAGGADIPGSRYARSRHAGKQIKGEQICWGADTPRRRYARSRYAGEQIQQGALQLIPGMTQEHTQKGTNNHCKHWWVKSCPFSYEDCAKGFFITKSECLAEAIYTTPKSAYPNTATECRARIESIDCLYEARRVQ